MQNVNIFRPVGFAARSFNELLKQVDAKMIRDSYTAEQKEEYVEEDEFTPAGILDIGSRILYGFQHGDVVKANVDRNHRVQVLCVISNASQDGYVVHSTQWDSEKKCWQFQEKTVALGDISSFIGHSFSEEVAKKNASKFHR